MRGRTCGPRRGPDSQHAPPCLILLRARLSRSLWRNVRSQVCCLACPSCHLHTPRHRGQCAGRLQGAICDCVASPCRSSCGTSARLGRNSRLFSGFPEFERGRSLFLSRTVLVQSGGGSGTAKESLWRLAYDSGAARGSEPTRRHLMTPIHFRTWRPTTRRFSNLRGLLDA